MSATIPEPERWGLFSSWCDGTISEAEVERLDAALRVDAEFRASFLAYVDQDAVLTIDHLILQPPHAVAVRGGRSGMPRGLVAGAALVLLGGLGLAMPWMSRARREPKPEPPRSATVAPGEDLALLLELERVGVGVGVARADSLPKKGALLRAGRFQLDSGRATLALFSGVTLTVEGPADLDLVAFDRVFCRHGKLRARVPKGAEGFVVTLPSAAVVDLGTEFGLNVEADGTSRVMVFEGLAEAALLDEGGAPGRTQLVQRGKSFAIDPRAGQIGETTARPDRFAPAAVLEVPPLVLNPSYADLVQGARPESYWRFESRVGDAFPNEVEGGPPLRAHGPVEISDASGENHCAVFDAGAPEQFLTTDTLWEISCRRDRAVEFWFLAESYRHSSLVGFHPPEERIDREAKDRYIHLFLVETTVRHRQSMNRPASVRFLRRWPLDVLAGNNLFSERVHAPMRWHHVVAQERGDLMELYLDGERERSIPLEINQPDVACRLVVGRRTPDPRLEEDTRPFVGRIDELAIYGQALSEDEIRRHFRSAGGRDEATTR